MSAATSFRAVRRHLRRLALVSLLICFFSYSPLSLRLLVLLVCRCVCRCRHCSSRASFLWPYWSRAALLRTLLGLVGDSLQPLLLIEISTSLCALRLVSSCAPRLNPFASRLSCPLVCIRCARVVSRHARRPHLCVTTLRRVARR